LTASGTGLLDLCSKLGDTIGGQRADERGVLAHSASLGRQVDYHKTTCGKSSCQTMVWCEERGRLGCHARAPGGVFMPDTHTNMEDTMALRVSKAELPAGLSESLIEQFGAVPEPLEVTWHNPKVARPRWDSGAR
jgi:hypothetical protein